MSNQNPIPFHVTFKWTAAERAAFLKLCQQEQRSQSQMVRILIARAVQELRK
jgi:hypothetical protein